MREIIICDDELDVAVELAEWFGRNKWSAVAVDSAEGVRRCVLERKKSIDVILTDVMMPREDGVSLLCSISASDMPHVFCFMTGVYDSIVVKVPNCDVVFRKPLSLMQVEEAIERILSDKGV